MCNIVNTNIIEMEDNYIIKKKKTCKIVDICSHFIYASFRNEVYLYTVFDYRFELSCTQQGHGLTMKQIKKKGKPNRVCERRKLWQFFDIIILS